MQFLNDLWESEVVVSARKKGTELFEIADAATAAKYAEVKPHIDDFIDHKAYPTYVKAKRVADAIKGKVTEKVIEFIAR